MRAKTCRLILALALGVGCLSTATVPLPAQAAAEAKEDKPTKVETEFMDRMIAHHEMGIRMGDEALQKAQHKELRDFAKRMQQAQRKDIEQLKQQGGSKPEMDMSSMPQIPAGKDFDRLWIESIMMHHQAALAMGAIALAGATNDERRTLIQKIQDEQRQDLKKLKSWHQSWFR